MYKITVNSDYIFEATEENNQLHINQHVLTWDIQPINDHSFHILKDSHSYTAELLQADYIKKEFSLKINGTIYQVKAQDNLDLLLEKLGMANNSSKQIKEIKAPMPGLILDVRVWEGQQVQKGEVLLILEAMKMENAIKSVADGSVKFIKVIKGQSVEKNQLLIEFE